MDFAEWYTGALTTAITVLFGFSIYMIKDAHANFKRDRAEDLRKIKELEKAVSKNSDEVQAFRSMAAHEFNSVKEKFKLITDVSRDVQAMNINLVRMEEKVRIIGLKFESDLGKVVVKD